MIKRTILATLLTAATFGPMVGCKQYKDRRPDVSQLDKRDVGLQSKDVVQASDQMAEDLLSDPKLNAASEQWTLVVDRVENHTVNSRFELDVFIQRLRGQLAKNGKGRIQFIENKAKYRELQSRELEGEREDTVAGAPAPGPKGTQPEYALWLRVDELPNRGTSYYQVTGTVSNMLNRTVAWTNMYEVRVER